MPDLIKITDLKKVFPTKDAYFFVLRNRLCGLRSVDTSYENETSIIDIKFTDIVSEEIIASFKLEYKYSECRGKIIYRSLKELTNNRIIIIFKGENDYVCGISVIDLSNDFPIFIVKFVDIRGFSYKECVYNGNDKIYLHFGPNHSFPENKTYIKEISINTRNIFNHTLKEVVCYSKSTDLFIEMFREYNDVVKIYEIGNGKITEHEVTLVNCLYSKKYDYFLQRDNEFQIFYVKKLLDNTLKFIGVYGSELDRFKNGNIVKISGGRFSYINTLTGETYETFRNIYNDSKIGYASVFYKLVGVSHHKSDDNITDVIFDGKDVVEITASFRKYLKNTEMIDVFITDFGIHVLFYEEILTFRRNK